MLAIEKETTTRLTVWINVLLGIERKWLKYEDVAGNQIISALLKETGLAHGATGFIYKVLQGVANDARQAGVLLKRTPPRWETRTA